MDEEQIATTKQSKLTYLQCLILVLSIYVLAALFIQRVFVLSPETNVLLDRIDFVICLIFIYDFFVRLYRADSKTSFLKWGWIDLVSSIPMFDSGKSSKYRIAIDEKITITIDISATVANVPFARFRNK